MSMRLRPDDNIPVSLGDLKQNFMIAGKWTGHRVRRINIESPIYVQERPKMGLPDIECTYRYINALEHESHSNKTASAILGLLNIYDKPYMYNSRVEEAKELYRILAQYTLVVEENSVDKTSKYKFARFEIPKDVSKRLIKWYKFKVKEPTLIEKLIHKLQGKFNAINSLNRIKISEKREEKQKSKEICNQIDNLSK